MNKEIIYLLLFARKLQYFYPAGLLTCSGFIAFPSCKIKTVARVIKLFLELTATGIVPDSHRIPF